MANAIELITQYSPKYWDVVYKQEAVTSILDANPKMISFTGTKTVKIGKWQNGGLMNYYRNNTGDDRVGAPTGNPDYVGAAGFGYQKSAARLEWEEFTLKQDRAAAFEIEYFDNEESGAELVGLGVTEISRTAIVPEVDAYCLSTIAGYTSTTLGNKTVIENLETPVAKLNSALVYLDEHEVAAEDQVIFVSPAFMNALRNTNEVVKPLMQGDFGKDVKFTWAKYEGRDLIVVSPERLRTDIIMNDGKSGGYGWASTSKAIAFMVVSKSAVMHVVKYEKVKIISGDANLAGRGFDGYTVFARIYHDVFVPDNKRIGIYAAVINTAAPAAKLEIGVDADGKIASILTLPEGKMFFVGKDSTSGSAVAVGSTIQSANFTAVKVGDAFDDDAHYCAIDSDMKVVATVSAS